MLAAPQARVADLKGAHMIALVKRIFSRLDSALAAISILLALVSTASTVFLLNYPDTVPQFMLIRELVIIGALLLIVLAILARYFDRESVLKEKEGLVNEKSALANSLAADRLNVLTAQFANFHNMVHGYRDILFREKAGYRQPYSYILTDREQKVLEELCTSVSFGIKRSLTEYFRSKDIIIGGDNIHISIKLLVSKDAVNAMAPNLSARERAKIAEQDQWVVTFFRDTETRLQHRDREVLGAIYTVDGNTSHQACIRVGDSCFVSNNLRGYSNYHNEKTDWSQHYNSLIALPIRYVGANTNDSICYGLIIVDSDNPDGRDLYDNTGCRNILGHAADILATFFLFLPLQPQQGAFK